ncbi:MAG: NPCBM/NEW2 domain-containing protein [Planctomycetes bacterium]|nr:NPCBM/NEW2 domain-containing protein [Planctomycetota bacterium]MBL7037323.1 NPCBM/NEW2 domain-containing protein [Pirellulaceae bacterium]
MSINMEHAPRRFAAKRAAGLLLLLATPIVAADGNDRYWAMLRDGTQLTGSEIGDLNDPKQQPTLEDEPLFDPNNPVRVVRDMTIQSALDGPFVEFANGDILPGKVMRASDPTSNEQIHPHLVVVPEGTLPIPGQQPGEIRVRQSSVRRIALVPGRQRSNRPGLMVYRNGSEVTAKSMRWLGAAIRALTESGILTVGLNELAELHLPERDAVEALLDDATWSAVGSDDLIVSVRTTSGGRLTYPRSMVQTSFSDGRRTKSLAVQPVWALDAIRLADQAVVFRTYRRAEEIPLSLLPVSSVEYRTALHLWPWGRNHNVLEKTLRAGGILADLGIGTHSHSEIAFDLPPHARQFYGMVGLDDSVADGGCVRCKVYRDTADGTPLFASGFLTGSQDPAKIGPLTIQGAQRLALVTEFGHEGRPADTDPLDIRDHVDWLMPWVKVDLTAVKRPAADLARWFAPLEGWNVDDAIRKRINARPWWNRKTGRWVMALSPDANKNVADVEPVAATRREKITLSNAYIYIAAGRDTTDSTYHNIQLQIGGEQHATTLNGDLRTNAGPGSLHDRVWGLGGYVGKEATLSLVLTPQGDDNAKPAGIVWGTVAMRPLIENLPEDGQPIKPDVPLTSLKPTAATYRGRPVEILAGKLPDGTSLKVLGYPFSTGFGVRVGTSITYELDPSYRRFVAVLGLADGWQAVGPYEILLDDEVFWTSSEPKTFDRNTPGCQLDIPIPEGHKNIQFRLQGRDSSGAWAAAGFMLD